MFPFQIRPAVAPYLPELWTPKNAAGRLTDVCNCEAARLGQMHYSKSIGRQQKWWMDEMVIYEPSAPEDKYPRGSLIKWSLNSVSGGWCISGRRGCTKMKRWYCLRCSVYGDNKWIWCWALYDEEVKMKQCGVVALRVALWPLWPRKGWTSTKRLCPLPSPMVE